MQPNAPISSSLTDPPGQDNALRLVAWLAGDECHDLDLSGLIVGFGIRLRAAGIPLDRLALHMRTLHPLIRGRTIVWSPGEAIEFFDRQHGGAASAERENPIYHVVSTHEWLTLRLDNSQATRWSTPDVFRDRDLVELFIAPLLNAGALASAASFATRQPAGFSASDLTFLRAVIPALRTASELKLLRRIETTLLATYVGTVAGGRIQAGHIRRGDVEALDAALMLCDLRHFTALSNRLSGERVLEHLNIYFDQVVPAITGAGGEILKFMGDAVLAYFHNEAGAAASCAAAFDAGRMALKRLATAEGADGALQASIALHYGQVNYGNIGSGSRLDFTVIGRDVNLVSRIQAICAQTGQLLLMSGRFADLLGACDRMFIVSVGRHDLKGFGEPVELFASSNLGDRAPSHEQLNTRSSEPSSVSDTRPRSR